MADGRIEKNFIDLWDETLEVPMRPEEPDDESSDPHTIEHKLEQPGIDQEDTRVERRAVILAREHARAKARTQSLRRDIGQQMVRIASRQTDDSAIFAQQYRQRMR